MNSTTVPTVDVPPIDPDFSAPFFAGFQQLGSYLLAAMILAVFFMLVIAIAGLAGRSLGPEKLRTWAGENILWIFLAAALLGAASGVFQWFVNFDFGF
jgi:hypothetical protein